MRDFASKNGTRVNGIPLEMGERRALSAGDVLTFGSDEEAWQLLEDAPPESEEGIDGTHRGTVELDDVALRFEVSRDEEEVTLFVVSDSGEARARPRSFHYLLLTLARARLEDRLEGLSENEEGWRYGDEVAKSLYPDLETLNVNVFRARKQLVELGVRDARLLVERRWSAKQLRIGVSKLSVVEAATAD